MKRFETDDDLFSLFEGIVGINDLSISRFSHDFGIAEDFSKSLIGFAEYDLLQLPFLTNKALAEPVNNNFVTTEGDDDIDAGFLVTNLNGLGGTDRLVLDYSGVNSFGQTASHVTLRLSTSTASNQIEQVNYTD
ncbi:MAG: hypothetical protein ABJN69_04490, partial [Hellea sp.]